MSRTGESLDSARERERQSVDRPDRHRSEREVILEPLPHVSELEVTPDLTLDPRIDESARTITPPYLRRFALPQGTAIDRHVTRGRGTIAASERFQEDAITDSTGKIDKDRDHEGIWREDKEYDPSFTHSPLKPGDKAPEKVEEVEGPSQRVLQQTRESDLEGATGESGGTPPFLHTGLFKPIRIPVVSGDRTLPLIPAKRSELTIDLAVAARQRRKTVGDRAQQEKVDESLPWRYSARNFPSAQSTRTTSAVQVSGIHPLRPNIPVTASSQVEPATTNVTQGLISTPTAHRQKDEQSDVTTPPGSTERPDEGEGLPEFLTRPSSVHIRPSTPREKSSSPVDFPLGSAISTPSVSESREAGELDFPEGENPTQISESSDVGKVIEQLAKLTLEGKQKPEPEDQDNLIDQTLDETRDIEKLVFELSELLRQREEGEGGNGQEQSTTEESRLEPIESSETSLKKPVSSSRKPEIPRAERVLLLKLQDTNQKLCSVTQSWKESRCRVTYLTNQNQHLLVEADRKDRYFEEVSRRNIAAFQKAEQGLRKENLEQLHELNTLRVGKDKLQQDLEKERAEKVHWSDLAKDFQRKLEKVLSTKDQDLKDLHAVLEEQEKRLADQQLTRQERDVELSKILEKQIQLNEQLATVTRERDLVRQELEALTATLEVEALRSGIPGAAIRRRLSSTVDPNADLVLELGGAVANGLSPIASETTLKSTKKVEFRDSPEDIIDTLGLGLGEVRVTNIWDTLSKPKDVTATQKIAAEKPFEDRESSIHQKTVLDPFQDYKVPGQLSHWDVFDPSQVVVPVADGDVVQELDHPTHSDQPKVDDTAPEIERRIGSLYQEYMRERSQHLSGQLLRSSEADNEGLEDPSEEADMPGRLDLMTKLSKPEPFFGKEYESGREWLRRFDSYCISGGYDPHQIQPGTNVDGMFRAGMISLLNGAAAVWLDSLPIEERNSYRALRAAFEKRWILPYLTGTRLSEETKLASRVMADNETVESVYQDLAAQCHKMGKGEQDLMIHFVRALRSDIQDRVVTGCPKDMMQAYQMAQAAEARLRVLPSAPSLTAMAEQNPYLAAIQKDISELKTRQEQLKQERSRPVCGYCQKTGHGQLECRTYKRDRDQMNQKTAETQKQKPTSSSGTFGGPCFNCGQKGHLRRDCPHPKKPVGNKDQTKTIEDLKKRLKDLEAKQAQSKDPK